MPLGTFTVTIDGNRLGAGTETAAQVQVRFASGREFVKDNAGGEFWFPHISNPRPVPVSLPHVLTLVTDVTTGTSTTIGYEVIVTTAARGRVHAGPFPAQAANTTIDLTDVTADFTGTVPEDIAVRAETARDKAETAAASVQREQNNGVAGLDGSGKIYDNRIPNGPLDSRARRLYLAGQTLTAIQAWLNTISAGDTAELVGNTTYSGTLNVPAGVTLDLSSATITQTSATATTINLGNGAGVRGGKIISPAAFDGTNTGSAWTYAVILATGSDCTVRDMTLTNVPRVGIGFKDATGTARVTGCTIVGNYPADSWTELETMHFGIGYDPGTTSSKLIAYGNTVRSCVQGVFLGNYGSGTSTGSIVQGNTFEGCHNHAVYGSASCTEISVLGNTVVDCSRPFALTGAGHNVSHNILTTTLVSGNLSQVCGIQIRDAVDSTIAFNRMKGNVRNTVPAIDLARSGSNTVLTGNKIIGNKVEVVGTTDTAIGIRVGTAEETTMHGNIVSENHVKGPGLTGAGLISFYGSAGSQGHSNKCINNVLAISGVTYGVYASEQRGLDISGNVVRLEFDAASAVTLGAVYLTNNTTGAKVRNNEIECTSSFGTNITFRGIWEAAATVLIGRYGHNRFLFDLTKLTTGVTHVIQGTSGSILDEALPGAPTTVCGTGSRWMRTDGGAGTTLYIKETAASSATWRAV